MSLCETILNSTDAELLVPCLCEEGLLDMKDGVRITEDQTLFREFLYSLQDRGLLRSTFAACVRKSCEKHRDRHLGHVYISALLEGRPFADGHTVALSDLYRKRIQENMTMLMNIDLRTLVPKLLECDIVTLKESELLLPFVNPSWTRYSAVLKLVKILESKGPTAYFLFVECLKNMEDHPPHTELYKLVHRDVDDDKPDGSQSLHHAYLGKRKCADELSSSLENLVPLSKQRMPAKLKIEEPLVGEEYDRRRKMFESYYHNGQWDLVEEESRKCIASGIPEIQAIGVLESALSWIFRRNKHRVLGLVSHARSLCQQITLQSDNGTVLLARCEYYLSLLYRYLHDYRKAESHVREARSILFGTESQALEDKSFTYYCNATIVAEQLGPESPLHLFTNAERLFERAIDFAHCHGDLEILVIHSRLQLARLYLGTTHTRIWPTKDEQAINKSRQCLNSLKPAYGSLDTRCKALFHLDMSDLHHSCGEVREAIEAARHALRMAQEVELVLEIEAAEMRIKQLSHTTACVLT